MITFDYSPSLCGGMTNTATPLYRGLHQFFLQPNVSMVAELPRKLLQELMYPRGNSRINLEKNSACGGPRSAVPIKELSLLPNKISGIAVFLINKKLLSREFPKPRGNICSRTRKSFSISDGLSETPANKRGAFRVRWQCHDRYSRD